MSLDLRCIVDSLLPDCAISASQQILGIVTSNDTQDFVTGENTSGTESTVYVDGWIQSIPDSLLGGTRFEIGDILVGISYKYIPLMENRLILNGETYAIVSITPVMDSGIIHYYDVQGRK